jgi:hypothetical protein
MPLQNRVMPTGEIVACPERGLLMGNRGGQFHRPDRTLGSRRWASRAWITCLLEWKGRRETVFADHHYTQLFFLDEATAFAAGHRPCALCRRHRFQEFVERWPHAPTAGGRPKADEIDACLHEERLLSGHGSQRGKRVHPAEASTLPDGVMVLVANEAYLLLAERFLPWSPAGYRLDRARGFHGRVAVLTPPSIVAVIRSGYRPALHPSATAVPI